MYENAAFGRCSGGGGLLTRVCAKGCEQAEQGQVEPTGKLECVRDGEEHQPHCEGRNDGEGGEKEGKGRVSGMKGSERCAKRAADKGGEMRRESGIGRASGKKGELCKREAGNWQRRRSAP